MNRKWLTYCIVLTVMFLGQSCYREETVFDAAPNDELSLPVLLKLDGRMCFFDAPQNMLRYSLTEDLSDFSPLAEHNPNSILTFNGTILRTKKSIILVKLRLEK